MTSFIKTEEKVRYAGEESGFAFKKELHDLFNLEIDNINEETLKEQFKESKVVQTPEEVEKEFQKKLNATTKDKSFKNVINAMFQSDEDEEDEEDAFGSLLNSKKELDIFDEFEIERAFFLPNLNLISRTVKIIKEAAKYHRSDDSFEIAFFLRDYKKSYTRKLNKSLSFKRENLERVETAIRIYKRLKELNGLPIEVRISEAQFRETAEELVKRQPRKDFVSAVVSEENIISFDFITFTVDTKKERTLENIEKTFIESNIEFESLISLSEVQFTIPFVSKINKEQYDQMMSTLRMKFLDIKESFEDEIKFKKLRSEWSLDTFFVKRFKSTIQKHTVKKAKRKNYFEKALAELSNSKDSFDRIIEELNIGKQDFKTDRNEIKEQTEKEIRDMKESISKNKQMTLDEFKEVNFDDMFESAVNMFERIEESTEKEVVFYLVPSLKNISRLSLEQTLQVFERMFAKDNNEITEKQAEELLTLASTLYKKSDGSPHGKITENLVKHYGSNLRRIINEELSFDLRKDQVIVNNAEFNLFSISIEKVAETKEKISELKTEISKLKYKKTKLENEKSIQYAEKKINEKEALLESLENELLLQDFNEYTFRVLFAIKYAILMKKGKRKFLSSEVANVLGMSIKTIRKHLNTLEYYDLVAADNKEKKSTGAYIYKASESTFIPDLKDGFATFTQTQAFTAFKMKNAKDVVLYLTIVDKKINQNESEITQTALHKRTGIDRTTINKRLKAMEKEGYITTEKRQSKASFYFVEVY